MVLDPLLCSCSQSAIFQSPSHCRPPLNYIHLFLCVLFILHFSFTFSYSIFYLTSLLSLFPFMSPALLSFLLPFLSIALLEYSSYFLISSPLFSLSSSCVIFSCSRSSCFLISAASCSFPLFVSYPLTVNVSFNRLSFFLIFSPLLTSHVLVSFPLYVFIVLSSPKLLSSFPLLVSPPFFSSPCVFSFPLLSSSCFLFSLQFVPFRDYIDRRGNHILSMARLAKEVLAEIPDQFLSYMRTRGIKPGPLPPPYTPCPPPAIHPLLTRRVSRI